ncbi:hypothetical protein D3C73_1175050 [compost metagenome]
MLFLKNVRLYHPTSKPYVAPIVKLEATSSRLSKLTPRDIPNVPQFDVFTKTEAVEAPPRVPPELVPGSADTTSH